MLPVWTCCEAWESAADLTVLAGALGLGPGTHVRVDVVMAWRGFLARLPLVRAARTPRGLTMTIRIERIWKLPGNIDQFADAAAVPDWAGADREGHTENPDLDEFGEPCAPARSHWARC